MTAPTRARTPATRSSTNQREQTTQRETTTESTRPKSSGTTTRTRSAAAERAYARRDERRDRSSRGGERDTRKQRAAPARRPQRQRVMSPKAMLLQSKVATARGPFVITVMSLLAAGLIATLWLATATVSGSYELQQADSDLNSLQERKETLMREVSSLDSTPALQRRASQLGMVPAPEPAHLKVNLDGSVSVVGEPKAASGTAPQPAPQPAPQSPAPQSSVPQPPVPQVSESETHRQAAPVPAVEGR